MKTHDTHYTQKVIHRHTYSRMTSPSRFRFITTMTFPNIKFLRRIQWKLAKNKNKSEKRMQNTFAHHMHL